jgi:hypothetical protein
MLENTIRYQDNMCLYRVVDDQNNLEIVYDLIVQETILYHKNYLRIPDDIDGKGMLVISRGLEFLTTINNSMLRVRTIDG